MEGEKKNDSWQTWALAASFALLMSALAGAGWAYTSLASKVDNMQATQSVQGERVAKLETNMEFIRLSLARIEAHMLTLAAGRTPSTK